MAGKKGIAQRGFRGVLIIRCLIEDCARSSVLGRGLEAQDLEFPGI